MKAETLGAHHVGETMPAGSYTLSATVYSGADGGGTAGTKQSFQFTLATAEDNVGPTVQLWCSLPRSSGGLTPEGATGKRVGLEIDFSEKITGFSASDVQFSNVAETEGVVQAIPHSFPPVYDAEFTLPRAADGSTQNIQVTIPAAVVHDLAGNPNTASAPLHLSQNRKLSVADASAGEGETLEFAVTLDAVNDCDTVTVDYATTDRTATAGPDYRSVSGTLTFGPGETSKTISVPVFADVAHEDQETLSLALSNASGATISDGEATGTIDSLTPPPPQVSGFVLTESGVTATTIDLSWTPPDGVSATAVKIVEGWSASGYQGVVATLVADATSYTVTGLKSDTYYRYLVRLVTADGEVESEGLYISTLAADDRPVQVAAKPPTGLTASNVTATSVDLSWTQPEQLAGVSVNFVKLKWTRHGPTQITNNRKLFSNRRSTLLSIPIGPASYTMAGLEPGMQYSFQIEADTSGGIVRSQAISLRMPDEALLNPAYDLRATNPTETTVDLAWKLRSQPAGVTVSALKVQTRKYTVSITGWSRTEWSTVATLQADASSYTLTGLVARTTYDFRIVLDTNVGTAVKEGGWARTGGDPNPPANVIASNPTQTTIDLSWTLPDQPEGVTNGPITIWQRGVWNSNVVLDKGTTSYTVTGLDPGTPYGFMVGLGTRWTIGGREGDIVIAPTVWASTASGPVAPNDLTAEIGAQSRPGRNTVYDIDFSWTLPDQPEGVTVTGVGIVNAWDPTVESRDPLVYRNLGKNLGVDATSATTATPRSHHHNPHPFRVWVETNKGTVFSNVVAVEVPEPAPGVNAPTGLLAENPTATSVDLRWVLPEQPEGKELTGVTVGYWLAGTWDGLSSPAGGVLLRPDATSHTVTGLTPNTAYDFWVEAVAGGESATSWSGVQARTLADGHAPGAPATLTAAPGDGQVTLTWTPPDNAEGITGWQMRHMQEPVYKGFAIPYEWTDWAGIAGSNAETTSHTVTGLANGNSYRFQLRAMAGSTEGVETTVTVTLDEVVETPASLTASFHAVPESHDGGAFSFELAFSENIPDLSYKTLRDRAFAVTNGRVIEARRLDRDGAEPNRRWEITVRPRGSSSDVSIALAAATDCATAGAICTADGRKLAAAALRVPAEEVAVPLTASFANVPTHHDGATPFTFELRFSEDVPSLSYKTLRDGAFSLTNGRVTEVRRLDRDGAEPNRRWEITVAPTTFRETKVTMLETADCAAPGAICHPDGRKLSPGVSMRILGPALMIQDATAAEGTDATLDFLVILSPARTVAVTVDYADGVDEEAGIENRATPGVDYSVTTGTLTFAPGETAKTISVPVLDDAIDEGREYLTMVLSNAQGARIVDGEALGMIVNSDPIPAAWLARFGRTVADQVLDAVEARLAAPRRAGAEASLAGQALPSWTGGAGAANDDAAAAERTEEEARAGLASMTAWLAQAGADGASTAGFGAREGGTEPQSRALTGRDFIVGTSFALTGGSSDGAGFGSLWGRGAISRFDGREGALGVDGEVTTGLIGADWAAANWTAGLMVGHSTGTGGYRKGNCSEGSCGGDVEATLTGLYPYAGLDLTERLSLWAAAGWGSGEVRVAPEGDAAMTADLTLAMGAAGLRSEVLRPEGGEGLSLAVKGDARFTRTSSDSTSGLEAAEADVWLVRTGIEGSRRFMLGDGGEEPSVTPSFEVGLRLDGGDAETGMGADLGGGLAFADPKHGLAFDLKARGLVAHESSGFREWGASLAASWDPRPETDRGLAVSLTQIRGRGRADEGAGGECGGGHGPVRPGAARDRRGGAGGRGRAGRRRDGVCHDRHHLRQSAGHGGEHRRRHRRPARRGARRGRGPGGLGAALQRDAADGRGRRRHRRRCRHRHRHRPGRHGHCLAGRPMNDTARHTIPRRLDDPERWLFWTVDEAAALMGPALLGLAANQFVPGLVAGVGGWLLLRRVKRGGGANIARYALYWFLPDFVLRLKATPPSHLRRFVG